jgi:hypothetical protein
VSSNDRTKENPRTESARRHDDRDIIEDVPPGTSQQGRSGGGLQRDVATAHPEKRVRDPAEGDNLTKEQELKHGQSSQSDANRGDVPHKPGG